MLAFVLALIQVQSLPVLKQLARVYVWVFRGTPLIVQMYIIFFGLPSLDITLNAFPLAVIAFSLNYAAYMSETLRASMYAPEGTYLVWVDFRRLGLSPDALEDFILHKAKLWLDSGAIFGTVGQGFQRFNIACPRATLTQALIQLETAVNELTQS